MDFEVGVDEVLLNFIVRNPTSGVIPIEMSVWVLGYCDFPVQMELTIYCIFQLVLVP